MVLKLIFLCLIGSVVSQILQDDAMLEALNEDFLFSNNEVPNYEMVPVFASAAREDGSKKVKIKLRAFGKDLEMWIHPAEGVLATTRTPVYTVRKGVQLTRQPSAMKQVVEKLYHNKDYMASMIVHETPSKNIKVHGLLGSFNFFIRPLYDDERFDAFSNNSEIFRNNIDNFHMIYQLPDLLKFKRAVKPPKIIPKKWSSVPETIYPEIMVIVDYPLYKLLKRNLNNALGYVLSFWNGVDLRYRSLQNPNYRLNIAGVIIAEEPNALEYMRHHSQAPPYELLIYSALDDSLSWLKKLDKLLYDTEFDVAITMSSEEFCRKVIKTGQCRALIGLAFIGGACDVNAKSAIIQDGGSYKGIDVTSHELGHLLGAQHDGTVHVNCTSERGNIMTPIVEHTSHAGEWSVCSIKDFGQFLEKSSSDCLFNKPRPGTSVPRFLPGKIMDAHQQCKKRLGTAAAVIDASTCVALRCDKPNDPTMRLVQTGAADGTPCGPGKMCFNKQCLEEKLFYS